MQTIKSIKAIIVLLWGTIGIVQAQNEASGFIPNLSPPTPGSFQFSRYGNIPLNNSTGAFNYSVPLWEVKSGNITVPVSLNYSTNGIKIDQIASSVGLGWVLNSGGVISRVIRDAPDERANHRYYHDLSNKELSDYILLNPGGCLSSRLYDTAQDWFSFNFPGGSGSFYFDENLNIHLASWNTLKMDFNKTKNEFTIVDAQGTTYVFGGTEAIEKTSTYGYDSSILIDCQNLKITTSWYLKEIKDVNGHKVTFSYGQGVSVNYIGYSNTRKEFLRTQGGECNYAEPITNSPVVTAQSSEYLKLEKIEFEDGEIHFINAMDREDGQGHYVKKITVSSKKNKQLQKIKEYELEYEYANSTVVVRNTHYDFVKRKIANNDVLKKRLFLKKVTDKGKGNDRSLFHRFVYKDKNLLPPRLSFDNDYWGFPRRYSFDAIKGEPLNLDKSSDWLYRGVMDSIIYPTKGITKIMYEPNEKNYLKRTPQYDITEIHSDVNCVIGSRTNSDTVTFTALNSEITVAANLNLCGAVTNPPDIFIEVRDLTTNSSEIVSNAFDEQLIKEQKVLIQEGHQYRVRVYTQYNSPSFFVSAGIKYFNGTYRDEETTQYLGGIRTKEIQHSPDGIKKEIKKVYYQHLEDVVDNTPYSSSMVETGRQFVSSYIQTYSHIRDIACPSSIPLPPRHGEFVTLYFKESTSSTFSNLYGNRSNEVYYRAVTVSDGENFENGAEETQFFVNDYIPSIFNTNQFDNTIACQLFTPYTPAFYGFDGTVTQVKSYKKGTNGMELVRELTHDYEYFNKKEHIGTNTIDRLWGGLTTDSNGVIDPGRLYYVNRCLYSSRTFQARLKSTVEKTYFDGRVVTTQTTNAYENPQHLLPTKVSFVNSDGDTDIVKTFYPDDVSQISGLSTQEKTAIERLDRNDLHNISVPVLVEQYHKKRGGTKETLFSRKLTVYRDWGNNLILPSTIRTSKSTDALENRAIFKNYDTLGNLQEAFLTGAAPMVYLWGYEKMYPIAKIENASFAEVAASLNITETVLKTYDETNIGTINTLRQQLPKAMVTTYVYDPLVGITRMTDPSGYTMTYSYDDLNRLRFVKDTDNNLISEHKYNYKN